MHQSLIILFFLIGYSSQLNSNFFTANDKENLRFSDDLIIKDNERSSSMNGSIDKNSWEARSNHFLNVFKNSDVQSRLKKTNPHLLKYLSNKEGHVFNDIMRKLSSNDAENNNNLNHPFDNNSNSIPSFNQLKDEQRTKKLEYEINTDFHDDNNYHNNLSSSENRILFKQPDLESMHAHETQNQDHKDQVTKLNTLKELISTSNDQKNSDKLPSISHRQGQYVPVENGNFNGYLSCCELFNKYGNKNFIHDDLFIIPRTEEYLPLPIHTPGPILMEYPSKPFSPHLRDYPIIYGEDKVPLITTLKELPKDTEVECIEGVHGIHTHRTIDEHLLPVHRIDSPVVSSRHLIHHIKSSGALNALHRNDRFTHLVALKSHGHSMPSNGHLLPIFSNGHLIPLPSPEPFVQIQSHGQLVSVPTSGPLVTGRRTSHTAPAVFHSPPPPPMILSKKLSLLGKKYLLG